MVFYKKGEAFLARWTPHPAIVTTRDNRGHIGILLYSYFTTITGWGVLLTTTQERTTYRPRVVAWAFAHGLGCAVLVSGVGVLGLGFRV